LFLSAQQFAELDILLRSDSFPAPATRSRLLFIDLLLSADTKKASGRSFSLR